MSGHTPTPWAVESTSYASSPFARLYSVAAQTEENAGCIAYLTLRPEEVFANAALIVRAVNNHDRLVDALEEAASVFAHYGDLHAAKPDPVKAKRNYDLADRMKVALASAKGGA